MKKFFYCAIAALMAVGCAQHDESDQILRPAVNAPETLYAEAEAPESRTYVEDERSLRWTSGDEISYFPAVAFNMQYRYEGESGSNNASFTKVTSDPVTGTALSCNYAVYPYAAGTAVSDEGIISLTLPAEQAYGENSFGEGANTMVCATKNADDAVLRFKNVGGYLKIKLYGEDVTVQSVTLQGKNNEKIAGAATVTAAYGADPEVTMADTATTTVTINCNEGVTLSTDAENPTAFWFVLPEVTFSNGFTITVTDINGGTFEKSTSNPFTIDRNMIQPMKALNAVIEDGFPYDWYTDAIDDIYEIGSPEELVAFSKLTNGDAEALAAVGAESAINFEGKTINLTADIDLSNCCSAAIGSWTPIGTFYGTFNGNNHKISNLFIKSTGRAGLFASVGGATIKDLTVQGEVTCTSAEEVGGIVAAASSSLFENCKSEVNVTTSTTNMGTCVGGICGWSSASKFIACQSTGNVSDQIEESKWYNYVGGIVGYSVSNTIFVACCKLSGSVKEVKSQSYSGVGGILGYLVSTSEATILSCYTSISIGGRQPGYITNTGRTRYTSANIADCYYSGNTYKGIGTDNYSGSSYSYDLGTAKSTDIAAEIIIMNEGIDEWNTANPDCVCNYKYELDENNVPKLVKQSEN